MVNFQRKDHYTVQDLREIMVLLRRPDGCPWDRAQTHDSIRKNMLEEAYEVAEAIDQKDPDHLREELGDVLLQVVFHARIEEEQGRFDLDDVADGICKKMIFRHPYVFGEGEVRDVAAAHDAWEAQKRREKGQKTTGDAMDAVARALPALTRAQKIQDKANRAGFDWDGIAPVLDKLAEELDELRQAVREQSNVEEELGDLLFAAAKAGRFLGLDSELALHRACDKFIRRFRAVEGQCGDIPMDRYPLEQLEQFWRRAKEQEQQAT